MNEEIPKTRPSLIWRLAAAAYVFINVAGAGYAVAMGEPRHAAVHVGLLILGFIGYPVWRRWSQTERQEAPRAIEAEKQLEYLQQSVDAIALEVERIGEAQRFNEKLRAEMPDKPEPKP
ncbi:MAG TPA: hypothetical protein VIF83_08175 [Gemmatimonadaceae bacterium]|jgi:hypothetical protein